MENYSGKLKIYSLSVLALSLIAAIMRVLAFFTDFDERVGYFNNSNPLYSTFIALAIITVIWCFSVFFTIPKNVLPEENRGVGYIGGFGAVFSIVASIAAVVVFAKGYTETQTVLQLIAAALFLISIGYFLLSVKGDRSQSSVQALFGIALILSLIMMLATVYFDMKVAMNSPIKVMLQLLLLALMLFFVSDIRVLLGRTLARVYLFTALLAVFFGFSSSLPEMLAFLFGKIDNVNYFMYNFVTFAYTSYAMARLFSYVTQAPAADEGSSEAGGEASDPTPGSDSPTNN